jgi:hypothetical protein
MDEFTRLRKSIIVFFCFIFMLSISKFGFSSLKKEILTYVQSNALMLTMPLPTGPKVFFVNEKYTFASLRE